ncbi:PREDICTED: caffeoylshikimate esterase-like [Tarenaya hassleriana]|uniref:caffeoylshikimate esterase-like n=1 Tax=Tarenaya hassleriana TaxID=28532 RepID=UPI00053C2D5C|nr:PREDICTED: caffeoylshikimate esterase-like [Tarenaya hassleriana]
MGLHPVSEANEKSPFGDLSAEEFYDRHGVSHSSDFITNSRGLKLFTQWWTPRSPSRPIGLVAVLHGFTFESSWFVELTSILFAESGFITVAIDLQGHGFSDGLTGYVPDINPVVDDCISFFQSFRELHAPPDLPCFLYGESLGGAIALYIAIKEKSRWDGLVLSGAMCEISDRFKPPWPLETVLSAIVNFIPTWRVVPTRRRLIDICFKEPWKTKLALANPRRTVSMPRAGTAYELLRVCEDLKGRFEEVEIPMMIVHGGDDAVCEVRRVEELHRRAKSEDKTVTIYPGMWHLLVGESEENVDLVFGDVVEWLKNRASPRG